MTSQETFKKAWLCAAILTVGITTASPARFAGGTGEPNAPYQIATAGQLIALGDDPNLWDKHFVLVRDLDLKGVEPNAMNPIGNGEGEPFVGVFDGGGHTIANLSIIRKDLSCVGLFGSVGGGGILISSDSPRGHVRNLHLRDVDVQGRDTRFIGWRIEVAARLQARDPLVFLGC